MVIPLFYTELFKLGLQRDNYPLEADHCSSQTDSLNLLKEQSEILAEITTAIDAISNVAELAKFIRASKCQTVRWI